MPRSPAVRRSVPEPHGSTSPCIACPVRHLSSNPSVWGRGPFACPVSFEGYWRRAKMRDLFASSTRRRRWRGCSRLFVVLRTPCCASTSATYRPRLPIVSPSPWLPHSFASMYLTCHVMTLLFYNKYTSTLPQSHLILSEDVIDDGTHLSRRHVFTITLNNPCLYFRENLIPIPTAKSEDTFYGSSLFPVRTPAFNL